MIKWWIIGYTHSRSIRLWFCLECFWTARPVVKASSGPIKVNFSPTQYRCTSPNRSLRHFIIPHLFQSKWICVQPNITLPGKCISMVQSNLNWEVYSSSHFGLRQKETKCFLSWLFLACLGIISSPFTIMYTLDFDKHERLLFLLGTSIYDGPSSKLANLSSYLIINISVFKYNVVVDKNRLTVDWTHHKRFEALPRWYLSEHTRKKYLLG